MAGNLLWEYRDPECYDLWDFEVLDTFDVLYGRADGKAGLFHPPGTILWKGRLPGFHPSVLMLPWGNFLYLNQYGTDAGPWEELLFTDRIREMDPDTGEMLWEWRLEDAISPGEHYCPLCIETIFEGGFRDWSHSNSVHFYEQDSTILLNVRNLNTILLISYPSGDVLWALGDAGTFGSGLFHHPHDPELLPNGNILLFDNDYHGEGPVTSRALEIVFDPVVGSAEVVWEWTEEGLYVEIQGDANHLPNDNVLVTDSLKGRLIEVSPSGEKVWEMMQVHPVPSRFHSFYKSERVALPGT